MRSVSGIVLTRLAMNVLVWKTIITLGENKGGTTMTLRMKRIRERGYAWVIYGEDSITLSPEQAEELIRTGKAIITGTNVIELVGVK